MSELMEEGLHLIESQERRLVGCRLCKVADIHDYRTHAKLLLHEVGHPCTTSLRAAREIVCKDHSDERTVCIGNLEAFHIRMVYRNVLELLILETPELCGKVKHTLTHILHLEVWLGLFLVKCIFRLAHLLCVICPVPRLYLRTCRNDTGLDVLVHLNLHVGDLYLCLCNRRLHEACKELVHCLRIAGHLVGKDHLCRSLISEKLCLLYTESHHLDHQFLVVILVSVVATGRICLEHLFPEGTVFS